jgi:hypothetical protein
MAILYKKSNKIFDNKDEVIHKIKNTQKVYLKIF